MQSSLNKSSIRDGKKNTQRILDILHYTQQYLEMKGKTVQRQRI